MLDLINVSYSYKSKSTKEIKSVLRNFSLSIKEGEFVSIIGPSGCGKTTLAKIVAGYIIPQDGSASINGRAITGPGSDRIMINQECDIFEWLTVKQNMEIACNDNNIINKDLDAVGIGSYINAYPYELSGGMKKRLSIARAISVIPKIIIMDEPFSSIDCILKEGIQKMALDILTAANKTMLFITHDIEEAIFMSDRVIVLSDQPTAIKKEIIIEANIDRNKLMKDSAKFFEIKMKIRSLLSK